MFMQFLLLLTSLLSAVLAVPLALRDVVSPPITSPTASTVWYVGQQQTVTWNTTGLPSNPTNPNGMLVLGFWYNNSENLMLNSPLATNLNYSVGQAQITVPNVPTGSDYIVVLFGDSGNASPQFTITNDASSSTPATTSSPTTSPVPVSSPSPSPSSASSASTSPSGNGGSALAPVAGSPTTTTTIPPSATSSGLGKAVTSSVTVVLTATSALPSPTQSNAAWKKHASSAGPSLGLALIFVYFALS